MASASSSSSAPSADTTATVWGPRQPALTADHADALRSQELLDRTLQAGSDGADPRPQGPRSRRCAGPEAADENPSPPMRREKLSAPAVAIIALEGMQSRRWAAPPTTSRSTRVTWAPRLAARLAAWLPAGPPPIDDDLGHRVSAS